MSERTSYSTSWYECGHGAGEVAEKMGLREHIVFWAEAVCEWDKGKPTEEAIAGAAKIIERDGGLVPEGIEQADIYLFDKLMLERSAWRESESGKRWHERFEREYREYIDGAKTENRQERKDE